MPSVLAEMEELVAAALQGAFPGQEEKPLVAATKNSMEFGGDYQCNNAMSLFAKLRDKVSAPREQASVDAVESQPLEPLWYTKCGCRTAWTTAVTVAARAASSPYLSLIAVRASSTGRRSKQPTCRGRGNPDRSTAVAGRAVGQHRRAGLRQLLAQRRVAGGAA